VANEDWERRPKDEDYFAERTDYVRQGDLFADIPLGYPFPPEAADHEAGNRKFISGPFESGFGMLLSPTCSMLAQGDKGYAHPVRMLAPVLSVEHLVEASAVKEASLPDLRTYDHLINYFYLPPIKEQEFPESLALIYSAITLHHDYLEERRIVQLSEAAAIHLKYKLAALFGGTRFGHEDFEDKSG
jgi:hypothetical protein